MKIEVAYARADKQLIIPLQCVDACTVGEAIEQSKIVEYFPEIDLTKNKVGIFSQICTLTKQLQDKDRVEIYRSLSVDPMEARRQRALKQQRR